MDDNLTSLDYEILRFVHEQVYIGYNSMREMFDQKRGVEVDRDCFWQAVCALHDQGLIEADIIQPEDPEMRGGSIRVGDSVALQHLLVTHSSTRNRRGRPSALASGPSRLAFAC